MLQINLIKIELINELQTKAKFKNNNNAKYIGKTRPRYIFI